MREQEAADYLQITPRTLYRYRKSGRLAFHTESGKTRPVIKYKRADLDALKAILDTQRIHSKKPTDTKSPLPRVSFGLPPHEYQELSEDAAKHVLPVNQYARQVVRGGLHSEAIALRQEVKELRQELKKAQQEIADAIEAVLEFVGMAPDEAQSWVENNLR